MQIPRVPSLAEQVDQKKDDVKSCVKMGAAFSLLLYLALKYEYYITAAFPAFMVAFVSLAFKNELRNLAELKEEAKRPVQKADKKQTPKVPELHPLQERKSWSWRHYETRKRMVNFAEGDPQYRSKSADERMSMMPRTNFGLGSS